MSDKKYNLGIDLGGTGMQAGVVDENYNIIGRGEMPTKMPRPADDIMDDMAAACMMAIADAGLTIDEIEHIGIGTPGTANSATGILEFAGNLDMHNYPMAKALADRLGREVLIANDANAAALGETLAGAAKGANDAICITLGTGVGGGIIMNGKIFCGPNFAGGEVGHTVIIYDGERCNCGRKGCWERYASATALIEQTITAMKDDPYSKLWEVAPTLEKVNGKTAFDAMRLGDETAKKVVNKYLGYVTCGLVDMVNIFQPDIICIGGGISKEKNYILDPIKKIVQAERFSKYSLKQSEIAIAQLGNDAGIIGAANLYGNI